MSLVLVADDEPALLEVVSDFVALLGYEVSRAHDGEEALEMARRAPPDLVIADHMMPRRTGLSLIQAMREDDHLRDVPVVIMSAVQPRGMADDQLYLKKPFDLGDLEHLIHVALRDSRPSLTNATRAVAARDDGTNEWIGVSKVQVAAALRALEAGDADGAREALVRASFALEHADPAVADPRCKP